MTGIHHWKNLLPFFCVGLFQVFLCQFVLSPSCSKVELVLDLSFTAGHQGDTLASAWAVTDGKGEPIGPRMVLEVVHLACPKKTGRIWRWFLLRGLLSMSFLNRNSIYIYTCGPSFQLGREF